MLKKCVVFKICYDKVIFSKDKLRIVAYDEEINSKNETKTGRSSRTYIIYVLVRRSERDQANFRPKFLFYIYSIPMFFEIFSQAGGVTDLSALSP